MTGSLSNELLRNKMQEANPCTNKYRYESTPRYSQRLNQKSEIRYLRSQFMTIIHFYILIFSFFLTSQIMLTSSDHLMNPININKVLSLLQYNLQKIAEHQCVLEHNINIFTSLVNQLQNSYTLVSNLQTLFFYWHSTFKNSPCYF